MRIEVSRRSFYLQARSFELFAHTTGHLHATGSRIDGSRVWHLGVLEVVYSATTVPAVAEQATN